MLETKREHDKARISHKAGPELIIKHVKQNNVPPTMATANSGKHKLYREDRIPPENVSTTPHDRLSGEHRARV